METKSSIGKMAAIDSGREGKKKIKINELKYNIDTTGLPRLSAFKICFCFVSCLIINEVMLTFVTRITANICTNNAYIKMSISGAHCRCSHPMNDACVRFLHINRCMEGACTVCVCVGFTVRVYDDCLLYCRLIDDVIGRRYNNRPLGARCDEG